MIAIREVATMTDRTIDATLNQNTYTKDSEKIVTKEMIVIKGKIEAKDKIAIMKIGADLRELRKKMMQIDNFVLLKSWVLADRSRIKIFM